MNKKTVTCAFRASVPVMAGYIVLGMGFGILMQSKGFAWYWAALMSLVIYAGSMQYVAMDLLGAGANMITFALMTLAVNARHLFYGLTMLTKYKDTERKKPYLIFALTDETFSLVCAADLPEEVDEHGYYLYVSVFNQAYWVLGTVLGALLGAALSFNSAGIEFSMTALFTVTVIGQWEKSRNHFPAIIGFAVSVICLLLFGADDFLIPSMVFITILLLAEKKWGKEKRQMSENMYILCAIGVTAFVTVFLRFAPFVVFRQKTPQIVLYLGKVLPEAIMAMLVVYCLKHVSFVNSPHALPEIIALAIVVGLHKWKHNTLLSILGGTVSYMVMVQMIFH